MRTRDEIIVRRNELRQELREIDAEIAVQKEWYGSDTGDNAELAEQLESRIRELTWVLQDIWDRGLDE